MRRINRTILAAIAVLALAAPAATAQSENFTSPAGRGDAPQTRQQDMQRAEQYKQTAEYDAAISAARQSPTVNVVEDDGFQWGDAAIGAGVLLAIALLGGAGFVAVHRRRESASPQAH